MNYEEAFAIWAPPDGPWSPWVKPVLFAFEPDWADSGTFEMPQVGEPDWLAPPADAPGYREKRAAGAATDSKTAYIVDLPGAHGVAWGIALAERGWRPIPLYNAIAGGTAYVPPAPPPPAGVGAPAFAPLPMPMDTSSLVDVGSIILAMRRATARLAALRLAADRPPAFLLDADRRQGTGFPAPGRFDNRSISLPTDFPSATFLLSRGITRAVLLQKADAHPQEDLAHTLLAWQQGGVTIQLKTLAQEGPPVTTDIVPPSRFRALLYRAFAATGLMRAPLGGFGGTIPLPSAG